MSSCIYCGPKKISHFSAWLENSMAVILAPLDRWLLEGLIHEGLKKVGTIIQQPLIKFLALIGIINYQTDLAQHENLRARVLFLEAQNRDIEMKEILFLGKRTDYFQAKFKNGKKIIFNGVPRLPRKKNYGLWWMDDKKILKDKLQEAGLPTPRGKSFSQLGSTLKYFKKLEKPVIVKPRLGSRGRHTTTFISNEKDLEKAFKIAKQLCNFVILEEHLKGDVYRGTLVDGKLRGVLGGSPPRITGDDKHTIKELIQLKNQSKPDGVKDFLETEGTLEFLHRLGYNLDSILPLGKEIDLTEKIGVNYGGSSFEVINETHPEIKMVLEKAAEVVGDSILGFDFIIDDIKENPTNKKWGIIECNSLPFINLHHYPLIGEPVNVAGYIWDLWEPL